MVNIGVISCFTVAIAVSLINFQLQRKISSVKIIASTIAVVVDENKSSLKIAAYGLFAGTTGACLITKLFSPGIGKRRTSLLSGPPGTNKVFINDRLNNVTKPVNKMNGNHA